MQDIRENQCRDPGGLQRRIETQNSGLLANETELYHGGLVFHPAPFRSINPHNLPNGTGGLQ
jgi:hypothetical protein